MSIPRDALRKLYYEIKSRWDRAELPGDNEIRQRSRKRWIWMLAPVDGQQPFRVLARPDERSMRVLNRPVSSASFFVRDILGVVSEHTTLLYYRRDRCLFRILTAPHYSAAASSFSSFIMSCSHLCHMHHTHRTGCQYRHMSLVVLRRRDGHRSIERGSNVIYEKVPAQKVKV